MAEVEGRAGSAPPALTKPQASQGPPPPSLWRSHVGHQPCLPSHGLATKTSKSACRPLWG